MGRKKGVVKLFFLQIQLGLKVGKIVVVHLSMFVFYPERFFSFLKRSARFHIFPTKKEVKD